MLRQSSIAKCNESPLSPRACTCTRARKVAGRSSARQVSTSAPTSRLVDARRGSATQRAAVKKKSEKGFEPTIKGRELIVYFTQLVVHLVRIKPDNQKVQRRLVFFYIGFDVISRIPVEGAERCCKSTLMITRRECKQQLSASNRSDLPKWAPTDSFVRLAQGARGRVASLGPGWVQGCCCVFRGIAFFNPNETGSSAPISSVLPAERCA